MEKWNKTPRCRCQLTATGVNVIRCHAVITFLIITLCVLCIWSDHHAMDEWTWKCWYLRYEYRIWSSGLEIEFLMANIWTAKTCFRYALEVVVEFLTDTYVLRSTLVIIFYSHWAPDYFLSLKVEQARLKR